MGPKSFRTALALVVVLAASALAVADECATSFAELGKTDRLRALQRLLRPDAAVGLVNETKGSYIRIDTSGGRLHIAFFSTGLFDLYSIHREGTLTICDDGRSLRMTGLDRESELVVTEDKIILGERSPKRTFTPGSMPELIQHFFPGLSRARESRSHAADRSTPRS